MSHRSVAVLPSEVIDLIAAGEVVDRPAAVIKELTENSLDAGANEIRVDLAGGGIDRIVVADDGQGMDEADLRLCVLRHATSKLRVADDLEAIKSLGFRGEALSSIAAVSRLTITSRPQKAPAGVRILLSAGEVLDLSHVGCPIGTVVEMQDLFFNTPARRKFLRSPATEQARGIEAASRTVLGARRSALTVTVNGHRLLDLPPGQPQAERVAAWWGPRAPKAFAYSSRSGAIEVSVFLSRPDLARADSKSSWFFVNGRFVRDRMLQRAVLDGYRSLIDKGRYPLIFVYVDLPAADVDVNVHPQKLEVRFKDSGALFHAVSRCINAALAQTPWLEDFSAPPGLTSEPARSNATLWSKEPGARYAPAWPQQAVPLLGEPEPHDRQANGHPNPPDHPGRFSALHLMGQALGDFLLLRSADELVLIDLPAARARILFEQLRRQDAAGSIPSQELLLPEVLELNPALNRKIDEQALITIRWLGIDIEPVGPDRFAVRAVPRALPAAGARRLVLDVLEKMSALAETGLSPESAEYRSRILACCARQANANSEQDLDADQVQKLLSSLDEIDWTNPAGQPEQVFLRWSRGELDRLFHSRLNICRLDR